MSYNYDIIIKGPEIVKFVVSNNQLPRNITAICESDGVVRNLEIVNNEIINQNVYGKKIYAFDTIGQYRLNG